MSNSDPRPTDISSEAVLAKGIRLTAAAPTIVAAHARIREGKDAIEPNNSLSHGANFLYMLSGETPDSEDARLIDKDLILHAEHGSNASAFAARVAASTQADFYAAITAGIAVLKGPLHGGAAEGVARMAMEIGSEENAESYINKLRARGERVMGIGHPVYRAVDPRSIHLKADAKTLMESNVSPASATGRLPNESRLFNFNKMDESRCCHCPFNHRRAPQCPRRKLGLRRPHRDN